MLGDKPHRFFAGHPLKMIETRKVHGARVCAQATLAAEVEVVVEVAQRQFPQGTIDWLAVAASGVVRLRHCAPAIPDFENGKDVIGIPLGFHIEQQGRKAENAQSSGSKDGAFKAVAGEFT